MFINFRLSKAANFFLSTSAAQPMLSSSKGGKKKKKKCIVPFYCVPFLEEKYVQKKEVKLP